MVWRQAIAFGDMLVDGLEFTLELGFEFGFGFGFGGPYLVQITQIMCTNMGGHSRGSEGSEGSVWYQFYTDCVCFLES